jgi:hypothetical protein
MKRQVERATRLVLGSILLLIGFIGGFIPVMQGWIFVIAGLTIMAPESRRARRALDWAKSKVKRDGGEADEEPQSPVRGKEDSDEQR